ncbi:transcription and mRNA export factor ENY2-like isoform X2 [Salvia splendens]|uniref:transcription and mRNA export factor ENY2-like isoform X2 n=1 Tax=Salvia splendens TaxID=180675 RepID=UPI001C25D565|nr:transcription and mRNA export factor ENY2-like isoform X2 [Salvia splendens]
MQKWSGQSTPSLQEIVDLKSGEKERLKELLVERLVECGWKDEMKAICREFARKKGRDTVTVHELVKVITPKGKASVPDSVKAEMREKHTHNFILWSWRSTLG